MPGGAGSFSVVAAVLGTANLVFESMGCSVEDAADFAYQHSGPLLYFYKWGS